MGRRDRKKVNPFAQKKRDKKNESYERPDKRSMPYQDIVRENESFIKYYKHMKVCPEADWDNFITHLKTDLPTTFRVTSFRGEAQALRDLIKNEFLTDYFDSSVPDDKKPMPLPWYPNEYAWQMQLSRKDIRRNESLFKLHNFLIAETCTGNISRQEAVSMIPPILLDVKPHHKVLDMCAAPGSKTAQLIEALHASDEAGVPSGFVIANDLDNNRCYMLVHQAKRMNSPCFMVTNHDSSQLPNFHMTKSDGGRDIVKFDRILCDVPCSGDGTMRKNPDIWLKWNNAQGLNLHGIQYRIAKRGAEMLEIGGRMVYSTCSLNPVENEAVLARLMKDCEGALEIVDATDLVPGLKHLEGMISWELCTKDLVFYKSFDTVPEKHHTVIRPQMFPPTPEDAEKFNLKKCIRLLPHLQDTGGFFVAAIIKRRALPWEVVAKPTDEPQVAPKIVEEKKKEEGPPRKKKKFFGYKEDPYVFFNKDEEVFISIKKFYDLADTFDPLCLLTRCIGGKKKNVYFCSKEIRNLVTTNEANFKIINTGVKTFVRCDNRNMSCAFRLAQEGLNSVEHFIGLSRRIGISKDDLITLLQCTDPTKPPMLVSLSELTQERMKSIDAGSCILKYEDEKISLTLVGWRGTQSLRAYLDANDSVHMLRLLGADISKYEKNKFKLKEENKEGLEDGEGSDKQMEVEDVDNVDGATDDNPKDVSDEKDSESETILGQ